MWLKCHVFGMLQHVSSSYKNMYSYSWSIMDLVPVLCVVLCVGHFFGVPPKHVAVNKRLYCCVFSMSVCWFYKWVPNEYQMSTKFSALQQFCHIQGIKVYRCCVLSWPICMLRNNCLNPHSAPQTQALVKSRLQLRRINTGSTQWR
jgi:hypothetical protein